MATFLISLYNRENKVIDTLQVVGRKQKSVDDYDNYYVSKKNDWGVRWVCVDRERGRNDVATIGGRPPAYHRMGVVRIS